MMKRCDICTHKCRTENKEIVCVKRLICLEGISTDFPCRDFSVKLTSFGSLVVLGLTVGILFILSLLA